MTFVAKGENRLEFRAATGNRNKALFGQADVGFFNIWLGGDDPELSEVLAAFREHFEATIFNVIKNPEALKVLAVT